MEVVKSHALLLEPTRLLWRPESSSGQHCSESLASSSRSAWISSFSSWNHWLLLASYIFVLPCVQRYPCLFADDQMRWKKMSYAYFCALGVFSWALPYAKQAVWFFNVFFNPDSNPVSLVPPEFHMNIAFFNIHFFLHCWRKKFLLKG